MIKPSVEPLPRDFYQASAESVAPALLGHRLLRKGPNGWSGGIIVETEAYLENDPASHAFKGLTPRNRSMFAQPGTAYVYLIYGMHYCVNASCRPAGQGEAVLVRAIQPVEGLAWMRENRPKAGKNDLHLGNGPAKLCQALKIDRAMDGVDLCDPVSPLVIAMNEGRDRFIDDYGGIGVDRRVGIGVAVEQPLRFLVLGARAVSLGVRAKF